MEINIQIKNVQKPEDIVNAFALPWGRTADLHSAEEEEKIGPLQQQLLQLREDRQGQRQWQWSQSKDEGAEIFVQNTTNQSTSIQSTIAQSTIFQSTIFQNTIFQGTIFQGTIPQGGQGSSFLDQGPVEETRGHLHEAPWIKVTWKAKSAPPSSSSSTPPRPATTGKDIYSIPATPSTFKFPKFISKYAVDWDSFEVAAFPVQDDMQRYVEALCASAKFRISGGVLLEHDLTWDRGGEATPETMRRFYYLAASDLALKDPPIPTKDMLPMNAHGVSQFNCNIFYALAHEICGGETDEYNILLGGKFVVAEPTDPPHGTDMDYATAAAYSATASSKPPSSSLDAIPAAFKEDGEHYDANLVFKSTLRKTVEPSAWSRAKGLAGMDIRDVTVAHLSRRGLEEYGLRPLANGFTGIILTRNVAETVLLSQIQKRLHEDNSDVDATIEAIYKSKNLKPPDKVKEATNFVTPLVEEIFLAMKPWTQVKNYGKNSEQDNQVALRMQELEVLPLQPPPSAPSDSQQTPSPPHQVLPPGHPPDSAQEDPPLKRRRAQRGDKKKQYEQLLEDPYNVIKQGGQQPPTSMTSIKTWVINLKKTMPADKHKELDQHIQQVHNLLEEGKYTKVQLQEMATRPAAATTQLQDRLREKGVVPELYTFSRFEQPCAVYVKLKFPKLNHSGYPEISKDTSFCYVGSTNLTVAKSEYNRVAKLKQLKQLKLPKTEIAIRYWHDKQNYELFSTLLLSQHQEYIDAWAEEHCLIQRWQPKLNYPFVTKELLKKAHGLGPARQQPHLQKPPDTLAKQLFKKIRRRLQGQKRHLANALPKQAQFWKILYAISSDTKQEHDASRELRSGKHDNETVTLLYRLANHMEQPWRSKARARLRRVLTFRNATVPKYNLPLKIPFLAHNDFKSNAQKCMGQSNLGAAFTNVGACYAFFPSKRRLHDQILDQLRGWHKHHLFPNDDRILESFETFFEEQWQQHKEQQRHEPRLTHRLIKHLMSALPDNYIIHNEDHANAHLMIYCLNVYNQAAFNSWMDKKTFLLLDKSPEDIKEDMERQTSPVVRKHYKKLLDYNKPIPYGYIMMKRKKQWSKGRTIIAYSNTCVGRLLRVATLALQQMLKATWPHHFGNIATPQLWQEVHELLQANEEQLERELIFLNHDLVGFFNSIPQADIIQSVRYLIAEFSKNNNDILLIDPYSKLNPVHSGKSTHSIKSNMTKINAQHIVDIIQFSFDACAFTAIGEVFRQTCGTSMGNQISPILSTCAIVSTEITWLRLYGQHVASAHLVDQLWIRRYVDNRAIIVDKAVLHSNPHIWQLASLQFYKKPVQLEDENCDDSLGFRINANNRQVSYILHPQHWRYRLPQSAGSRKLRLSGYHSRRHMIESTVFPQSLAQQQLQALDDLYLSLGFRDLA
ncbi:hypothetical protein AK812_SmicGene41317 [Symbiodinium microadriaticum]|uniref:Reverse transcriptase domain-containing protein n=1 Tax=Symbiodinium microadriaticum TaxID=2951 RepID=A0A1Q9C6E1_SYMMI|nr:hypothetical protein AK812_SmicGene41317 [Symbiodinium microadriaticum]